MFNVDIGGSILEAEGTFIPGAMVEFDGQTAITDMRGVFLISDVTESRGVNYIKVSKPRYFDSGRNITVLNDGVHNVRVRLEPRVLTGTFSGASGGTIITSDGIIAEIPAGAFEGGYTGMVNAYTRYLDPDNERMIELIPGLEGEDQNGDFGMLQTFGMGQFEFEDENGNLLDLAQGQTANLSIPVPASMVGIAQATISLWYFDEAAGLWKEEGEATLNGDHYEGSVNHFSWWNCDDFSGCTNLFRINISCGGSPFPGLPAKLVIPELEGLEATGVTNSNGMITVVLPCSQSVVLSVLPNGGDEYVQVGTFPTGEEVAGDAPPPEIDFDAICEPHATVTGTVLKEDLSPVTNGYAYLRYDDFYTEPVFFDEQGSFFTGYYSFDEEFWNEVAEILVWDLDNFTTAVGPTIPFNEELNVLDAPNVIGGEVASVVGRIYIAGTAEDAMYCIDSSNGELIWSVDEGQMEREVSPVFYDGRIYVRNLSGLFYCFNGFDGSEIWSGFNSGGNSPISDGQGAIITSRLSGLIKSWNYDDGSSDWTNYIGSTTSELTLADGLLYAGQDLAGDTSFVAMGPENGEVIWAFNSGSNVNSSSCVANGKVFFGDDSQEFYALDGLTGELQWQATFDDGPYYWGSPTTGAGLVFVQSVNHVRAFDQNTGVEVWEYTIISSSGGEEPYYWNHKLYVSGDNSGPFLCLDAMTGQEIWSLEPTGQGETANYMVVVDGVLFMQRFEEPHTLEARNANTGALLWTSDIEEDLDAPMVVVDEFGQAHYCTLSGMQQ